jgi:RNA polymerase primary sigma factor
MDNEELAKIIATLPVREQEVLNMRLGLNGNSPLTQEEIAKHFEVTPPQIREIEGRALRRLRHPKRSRMFKKYE